MLVVLLVGSLDFNLLAFYMNYNKGSKGLSFRRGSLEHPKAFGSKTRMWISSPAFEASKNHFARILPQGPRQKLICRSHISRKYA